MLKPYHIFVGDALETLRTMHPGTVNTCVTSPPYYGLRDYGVDGQIGLEETPEAYIARLVEIFAEVRRVLRDDGTLWVNLGDSYYGAGYSRQDNTGGAKRSDGGKQRHTIFRMDGIKQKDLIGIPWMLAFALRADGWYLRQDLIWAKPNPMPESVTDRCTKAHEYVFLLSKSRKYYYDQEAITEPVSPNTHLRLSQNLAAQIGSHRANGGAKTNGPMKAVSRKTALGVIGIVKNNPSFEQAVCLPVSRRNKRSVWTVTTRGFKEAHFATFPPALIEPCILAGAPAGGLVLDPFAGAGTTGMVALKHGRAFVGIELNADYAAMAERRIEKGFPTAEEATA